MLHHAKGHVLHSAVHQQHALGSVKLRRIAPRVNQSKPRLCVKVEAVEAITTADVAADFEKYTVGTYVRPDVVFTRGEGCRLYDVEGKEYLDFAGGIAVNALGHSDPRWVKAVVQQAETLTHTSNLFHTLPAIELAKKLVDNSFADKVFFCNSGTEANEAAIKFARKWAKVKSGADPQDADAESPIECVSFTAGFHGRTMGALALTPKAQYQNPFGPVMPGHVCAEWGNLDSAKDAIQAGRTCAVFVEPIQVQIIPNAPSPSSSKCFEAWKVCHHNRRYFVRETHLNT